MKVNFSKECLNREKNSLSNMYIEMLMITKIQVPVEYCLKFIHAVLAYGIKSHQLYIKQKSFQIE